MPEPEEFLDFSDHRAWRAWLEIHHADRPEAWLLHSIWWAYPLYLFSVTSGLRRLWDWGYRKFRDNRHQFSSACGLPSPEASE